MAKKKSVDTTKIESFGNTNNFLILLLNALVGLFLGVCHINAFDIYMSAVPNPDPEMALRTMTIQLLVAFTVLFIVSLVLGLFNKKALANKTKGIYVIFGILMVLDVVLVILNIPLIIELF